MKLVDYFQSFLVDTVNLNATRLEGLEDSVEALKSVISSSDWAPRVTSFVEQGSWAHRTIIKPVEGKPFDADVLVMVDPVSGWDARTYLTTLRAVFAGHGIYKDKVRRFSHCVTIEYAGDRKIDVAPCVVGRLGGGGQEVCNYNENAFEASAPEAYTTWLVERNTWVRGDALKKVTRLLKYLRDIKGTFTCASFLLTTMLGQRIVSADASNPTEFTDLPTALRTITTRLDVWLQCHSTRPTIANPVLPSEILSDLWSVEQYENFRSKVHQYREWIDDAYLEADRDESIGKWRRVFGDDFAKDVAIDKAARVTEAARQLVLSTYDSIATASQDLVALFCSLGRMALPPGFDSLPHKQRPPWKRARNGNLSVRVVASLHRERHGTEERAVSSGEGPLRKGRSLRFVVRTSDGFQFGREHDVRWRITNTDREASDAGCLRGGFEKSEDGHCRWESLLYRGVHTVEAFVLRRSDTVLVAQSDPFYVVVE